jgi:hypothetical protein
MSIIDTHEALTGVDDVPPEPSSPLLQFRDGKQPPSGHPTIAQLHLANMLGIEQTAATPISNDEVLRTPRSNGVPRSAGAIVSRALIEHPKHPEGMPTREAVSYDYSSVIAGVLRTDYDDRVRTVSRTLPERVRDAASAVQLSLRPRRSPVSSLSERTITCALDFLNSQLPEGTTEGMSENRSALVSAYGYIAQSATSTEHYALASYATSRILALMGGLHPETDALSDGRHMEAVATMYSALAMRAYGALRAHDELSGDASDINKQLLLLQAEQDEQLLRTYFAGRAIGGGEFGPLASSGYADWDMRAMRYFLGYHHLNGTMDQLLEERGVHKFLKAVTHDDIVKTSLPTIMQPLQELQKLIPEPFEAIYTSEAA